MTRFIDTADLADSDRRELLAIEQDCREADYEASKACWKDCDVYDAYHTALDREQDWRESQVLTHDEQLQIAAPCGEWLDADDIAVDDLPFA